MTGRAVRLGRRARLGWSCTGAASRVVPPRSGPTVIASPRGWVYPVSRACACARERHGGRSGRGRPVTRFHRHHGRDGGGCGVAGSAVHLHAESGVAPNRRWTQASRQRVRRVSDRERVELGAGRAHRLDAVRLVVLLASGVQLRRVCRLSKRSRNRFCRDGSQPCRGRRSAATTSLSAVSTERQRPRASTATVCPSSGFTISGTRSRVT
jgi:hypothetical protein